MAGACAAIVNSRDSKGGGDSPAPAKQTTTKPAATKKVVVRKSYVVRSGDTLSAISIDTGVSIARIQALNPNVDVQALQPGQRLKLRR